MHTFRKTEIPALLDSWVTNTPSVKVLCPKKLLLLMFPEKHEVLMFWSIEDLPSFFLSPLKLYRPVGGLRQIAAS